MSNAVYPSLPGLEWPQGRVVLAPPVLVRTTPSQREYRARDAVLPRYLYRLSYEFLKAGLRGSDLATLVGFYNAHGGPFDTWLFADPDDSAVVNAPIGAGTGITTAFPALRPFGGFSEAIDAFVGTPTVYVNGTATSAFSVTAGSGVITFASPPSSGAVLTWSGGHYRRCRFMGDKLDTDRFMQDLYSAKRVEFISSKT